MTRVWILAVGRPGRLIGPAIEEYERRAARYWNLEARIIRQEPARGLSADQVRDREGQRLLDRLPVDVHIVALTRAGKNLDSKQMCQLLLRSAERGTGTAFVLGGAFGLSDAVMNRADRQMKLSALTLPHDLARLVLAEQLYRAGTIWRGEPYHKGGGTA